MENKTSTRGLWDGIPLSLLIDGFKYADPQLSPDGNLLAYLMTTESGTYLFIFSVQKQEIIQLNSTHPLSTGTEYGGGRYCWSSDSEYIIFSSKGTLYRLAAQGGEIEKLSDISSSFAPHNHGDTTVFSVEGDNSMHLAIIDSNWPQQLDIEADFVYDAVINPVNGDIAVHAWSFPHMSWNNSAIYLLEKSNDYKVKLVAGHDQIATSQPRFSPDGKYLAFNCDETGWLNLWISSADGTGARVLVDAEEEHSYSTWVTGERNFQWTSDSKYIVFTRNRLGFVTVTAVEISSGRVFELDNREGNYTGLTLAGDQLALVFADHKNREQVIQYEIIIDDGIKLGNKRVVAQSGISMSQSISNQFVKPRAISCMSEGIKIHALLYQYGDDTGPKPTIFAIHGGPTGMVLNKFHIDYQYFASRGWVVVAVNHRGSIGYGREYRESLNGNWGVYDVEDTRIMLNHLVEEGITDPDKTVIYGGSAGGYTVLMMMATYPELMTAGVDLFGVADIFMLSEETHYLESQYDRTLIGKLPEDASKYRDRSPVYIADRITHPLLILQGEDDPVVPINQSEAIRDAVRGYVEYKTYPGETHGFSKRDTIIDVYHRIEKFLKKHVLYS